ncbi:2,3-butanediol dehydrogenase [Amycolatopsis aidingensis]|uniref:2,3-butanediol dehydrogenase n=1 Tax=Amycolatopsis aidingensis TaxID=2842453 RepID=UPI001C0ACA91|nr:2,3-butanediol dehydrogenase [Amycolatopsis aidingensis]
MRAAVWHGAKDVRVTTVDIPEPRPGEVRIEVAYCGICGSDLHEYTSGPHAIPVTEPHPASGVRAPLVLGHEFCGTITATGPEVSGLVPGTKVAVEPNYRCGTCARCAAGEYNICRHFGFAGLMGNGGLAEYATVPAYMVHPLPDSFPLEQAALLEPAAVALHSLRRAELLPADTMLVLGLGPIGLLIVQLAAQRGVRRIIAADLNPKRLDLAIRLGATDILDARQPDLPGVVRALTDGTGVDLAFEVVGAQTTVRTCLASTRPGGRMILVGLGGELRIDAFALVNDEQSIITSVGYRDCHPELIRLVGEGSLDLSPLITSIIPLEDVVTAGFHALTEGTDQIKVLVRPGAGA